MSLPEKCIQEFRSVWKQSFGEELDYESAEHQAEVFLNVVKQGFLPNTMQDNPKNNGPPP